MRYLALAAVVVLAVAAPCAAELAELRSTLVTPASMNLEVEVTFYDPMWGTPVTASDNASSALTGTQDLRLDCTFHPTTHAVTSVNSIVFLLNYDQNIDFQSDPSLALSFVGDSGQFATVSLVGQGLGGSLSTGRQDRETTVPDPMPVTGNSFPLDRDQDPQGDEGPGDMLFYLNQGTFIISGNYAGSPFSVQWWFDPRVPNGSEAWNDWDDMPGNGTVSVALASVVPGEATYDVDASVPVYCDISIPNDGTFPSPDPVGHAYLRATLDFEGQFTRVIPMPAAGDADGDGDVDATDASILGKNWLQSGTGIGWAQGDFNGDHAVNDQDAAILADHWGDTGGAVPEPSTVAMLLALTLAGLFVRRSR